MPFHICSTAQGVCLLQEMGTNCPLCLTASEITRYCVEWGVKLYSLPSHCLIIRTSSVQQLNYFFE